MRIYRFALHEGRPRLGVGFGSVIYDIEKLYASAGKPAPEAVTQADIKSLAADPSSVVAFLRSYFEAHQPVSTPDGELTHSVETLRILAPIPRPNKFICVGLNYLDHCEEQHVERPKNPVLFAKFANAIRGQGDKILKPRITQKLDYEGELGVVIGAGGRGISRADALKHVFGYTVVNDVSARDIQKNDGQWLRAKSQDSFAPTGPCVTLTDEIPDPQDLTVKTRVNGQLLQDSNTSKMIFGVAELIEFASAGMTLEPGDILSTGTPAGVGVHRNPPILLKQGDRVEIEIERIGTLANEVVEE